MSVLKRVLVAITLVALTFGLTALPTTSAQAAPGDDGCTAATQATSKADEAVKAAKAKKKKTKKKVAAKKKAVKKAKKNANAKKVKKAKAKLKKAKKKAKKAKRQLKTKKRDLESAKERQAKACSAAAPTGGNAFDLGSLLALLAQAGGTDAGLPEIPGGVDGVPLDPEQLAGVLALLSGGGDLPLDPAMLADLLAGFSSFDPADFDPTQFADLLSGMAGGFDPAIITDLFGDGSLDPAIMMELFAAGMEALMAGSDLPFDFPTDMDPAVFLDLFQTSLGALTGQLDPAQLGELFGLLMSAGGAEVPFSEIDLDVFTGLLEALFSGNLPEEFSASFIDEMFAGFEGLPVDPSTFDPTMFMALLGGAFSPDQLTALFGDQMDPEVLGAAFATLLAQFSSVAGDGFEIPELDAAVLTTLVANLATLVTDLLGGLLGGGDLPELPGLPGELCVIPIPLLCS